MNIEWQDGWQVDVQWDGKFTCFLCDKPEDAVGFLLFNVTTEPYRTICNECVKQCAETIQRVARGAGKTTVR